MMLSRRHIALTAAAFISSASGRGNTGSTPFTAKKQTQILRMHARRRLQTETDPTVTTVDQAVIEAATDPIIMDDVTLLYDNGALLSEAPVAEEVLTEEILTEALKNKYGENWSDDHPYWNEIIDTANAEGDFDWQTLTDNFEAIVTPGEFAPETYKSVIENMGEHDVLKKAYLDSILKDMKTKLIEDGTYSEEQVTTTMDNLDQILTADSPVLSDGEQAWLHEMSRNIYGTEPVMVSGYQELGLDQTEWESLISVTNDMQNIVPFEYDPATETDWILQEAAVGLAWYWYVIFIGVGVGLIGLLWSCMRSTPSSVSSDPTALGPYHP